jgi:S1-C subfamily serine protease
MNTTGTTRILAAIVALWSCIRSDAGLERSIFRVSVTFQEQDEFQPWQMRHHGLRSGFAAAVSSNTFITTESLVRGHRMVELMRSAHGDKIPARVLVSDAQINLAMLRADTFPPGMAPEPLAMLTNAIPDDIQVAYLGKTTDIETAPARLQRIAVDRLPSAPYQALQMEVITDMQAEDDGVPILSQGHGLAGLVMNYSRGDRSASALPAETLARFVSAAERGQYRGLASAGFSWMPLVDPAHRAYRRLGPSGPGILVLAVHPWSRAGGSIRPGDVILGWDNHIIDNMGYYQDISYGRIEFPHLINGLKRPGDTATVSLRRDGSELQVTVPLATENDDDRWIPDNVEGSPGDYLIAFGLVIRELTGRYLLAYGSDWKTRADTRLVHLYLTSRNNPPSTGARVVIVSSVLPDDANIGYQSVRDQIVTHVNGQPVSNLSDVFKAVDSAGAIRSVRLHATGVDLAFDPAAEAEANLRISRQYGIQPSLLRRRGSGGRTEKGSE